MALADRILPALTVRMARIRFLTAIAVGSRVCADYDDDAVVLGTRAAGGIVVRHKSTRAVIGIPVIVVVAVVVLFVLMMSTVGMERGNI